MKQHPLVTSILITYNHEDSIRNALDSMLRQKTDFAHKIRIEDDCSTDGTTQICMEYASRFPDRIEFTPKPKNLGVVKNIFHGVSQINSEFYATLEGDDYWSDDHKLQKQVSALQRHPDCSFCGHNTLCKQDDGTEYTLFTRKKNNIRETYSFPSRFRKKSFVKTHPSSRLYRTSALELDQLRFKGSVAWDSSSYWYFLSQGSMYYIHDVMSVYHYNGDGVFSGSSNNRQRTMSILNSLNINEELGFAHNHIFMPRILRHKKLLNLSARDRFLLRINPKRHYQKYSELRAFLEAQL